MVDKILKYFFACFTALLIPVYWHYYGPTNFLWLSDIGFFLTTIALWKKDRLLMSMAAVGVLFLELVWVLDFVVDLFTNHNIIDLSDYMFDAKLPASLRALSLFHLITPVVWLYYLKKWGYDKRALRYFTILYAVVILLTYYLSTARENINWVFLAQIKGYDIGILWPITLIICVPIFIFLPTHYLLKKFYEN